ncbi:MAG: DNA-binding response regulator [Deltaproteobacteria bacterium RIFCSPLOWO2_12_FULL_60_19]|nr:MAG: DNA-binding response regulator [Deltaproteobacteria bacterium RIFCSPLOWO2_12_FULL_60_19]
MENRSHPGSHAPVLPRSPAPLRVLIADDHPVVRQGLKQILADEPDVLVAGEAANARDLLEMARRTTCDVILLDVTMPGRGGLEALKDLRRDHPKLPVLILSIHPEDQLGVRAIQAGAAGYVTKDSAPEQLVNAIRKVCGGGKYITPALAERLAAHIAADSAMPLHEALSDREFEVLRSIGGGKTASQIARELSLSVKTISTYRGRLLQKLQLKTNAQLTRYALDHQLL